MYFFNQPTSIVKNKYVSKCISLFGIKLTLFLIQRVECRVHWVGQCLAKEELKYSASVPRTPAIPIDPVCFLLLFLPPSLCSSSLLFSSSPSFLPPVTWPWAQRELEEGTDFLLPPLLPPPPTPLPALQTKIMFRSCAFLLPKCVGFLLNSLLLMELTCDNSN